MNTPADGYRDPDALEREVDARRSNLNQTLNQVEQRLSPNHLMEQTMDYFGQHGGDIAQSVSRSIKENPLPLLLTGVGIAWLMSSQSRSSQKSHGSDLYHNRQSQSHEGRYRAHDQHGSYARTNLPVGDRSSASDSRDESGSSHAADYANRQNDESLKNSLEQKAEEWSRSAGQWKEELSTRLMSMKQEAEESAEQWQERVINASIDHSESMQYHMRHASQQLSDQARVQSQNAKNFMQEQPLVVGALGIAAGALVGALLPNSSVEDKAIGEHADKAKAVLAEKGRSVSREVSSTIREQAGSLREKGEEQLEKVKSEEAISSV